MAAAAQACGRLLIGTAVARTVAERAVVAGSLVPEPILGAMLAALCWALLASASGGPCSSHALIGGLAGAAPATAGSSAPLLPGLVRVWAALLTSPALGPFFGFDAARLMLRLARSAGRSLNTQLRRWQQVTMMALGISHGASDGPPQATGVRRLGLAVRGRHDGGGIPGWVVAAFLRAFCLRTSTGGWRQMRRLGSRICRLRPLHGFGALVGG